jgi:penicillin-binding protein 2
VSAIGNGYMWATPLQLATAVSIMANSGKVVAPRMLKSIEGETELPLADSSIPDVIVNDPDYWRYMQESMTMVVHKPFVSGEFRHNGGAYEYIAMKDRNMAYKMAGKTGTAQLVGISQDVLDSSEIELQDKHKDHGLFVSYAPAENPYIEPKIALAVFVENGEHGGSVASPIAKEITDAYLLDILQIDFAAISSGTDELVSLADE